MRKSVYNGRRTRGLRAAALWALLPACGGGDGGGGPSPVFTVTVSPGTATVIVGGRTRLTAAVRDAGGRPATATITWSSSNPLIATVAGDGTVTGQAPGQVAITARAGSGAGQATVEVPPLPRTGVVVPALEPFDRIVTDLMVKWGVPGGALAVVRDGRLVLARGYGYADLDQALPVQPASLFRIASVSKPITAVAALKLHEEGRLDLDAPAFGFRPDLAPPPGAARDPRLAGITVRQLLWHVGGWDRSASGDPMFRAVEAAQTVGAPSPGSCETIIRYMLGRPLDFDPGTRYAYSNFGYCVLGRIIAQVSGRSYEDYVRTQILAPLGITTMRIGTSLETGRAPGEVRYYDRDSTLSVFGGGLVPWPYGGFHLEAMDSHGGWIASAPDLLRFLTAVDGFATRPDLLRPETIALMQTTAVAVWGASPYYYAMGWLRRPQADNWWHDGSLPGTTTLLVRTGNGLAWAALFNARNLKPNSQFAAELDPALWQAVGQVATWPGHDLWNGN